MFHLFPAIQESHCPTAPSVNRLQGFVNGVSWCALPAEDLDSPALRLAWLLVPGNVSGRTKACYAACIEHNVRRLRVAKKPILGVTYPRADCMAHCMLDGSASKDILN
eukprot:305550-Amphidinium_carterae.1